MKTPHSERRPSWRWALGLVALGLVVRAFLAARVPPFPDETYYWEWSRRLAAGYFDHPPGIAYLIAAGTALLGHTVAGIRLGAVVAGGAASLAVVAMTRGLGGDRAALRAAVILTCMPLAAAGLLLSTPDAPLLLAAAGTFFAVDRALVRAPGTRRETMWWLAAGLAAGVGFNSKLTALLVPFGITVAFLVRPELRRRLAAPGPWLAAAVAVALFVPFLLWNAGSGWISFAYQLGHGLGRGGGSALLRELELLGGQMALVSPILFVLMAAAVVRGLRDPEPRRALLAVSALVLAGVFVVSALRKPVEANWPAAAYVPGTVLLATATWSARGRAWFRWGAGLGAALVAAVYLQALVPWMPVAADDDPIARAHGWDALAGAVGDAGETAEAEGCPRVWKASRTYQAASQTAFHLPGQPLVLSTNLMSRSNQYDLWPGFPELATPGDCLILFGKEPGTEEAARLLRPHFDQARRLAPVTRGRRGATIDVFNVWVFRGWSGDGAPFERDDAAGPRPVSGPALPRARGTRGRP